MVGRGCGCDDSQAQALDGHWRPSWGGSRQEGLRHAASRLFELVLPGMHNFTDLRPAAFAAIALHDYLPHFSGDRAVQEVQALLAERRDVAFRGGRRPPHGLGLKTN